MKTIKNVLVFALLMAGTTAFAQQKSEKKSEAPGQKVDRPIVSQLNLSSEQQARLKKIHKEFRLKDSIAAADFRKQKEQMKIERIKSFKSILNKEQLEKFEKMQLMHADAVIFEGPRDNDRMHGQGSPGFDPRMRHRMMMEMRVRQMGHHADRMHALAEFKKGRDMRNFQGRGFQWNGRYGQMAQSGFSMQDRAKRQTEMMTKFLNLDEKQSARIKEINLKYARKDSSFRNKEALKETMIAKQQEIKSVLNKDQAEKFDSMLAKMKKNMKQGALNKEENLPEK